MFSQTPDIYVKSNKENRKIFTLFNNSNQNILCEIEKAINTSHVTYNSIILTSDNKMILCNRRLSFYASYMIQLLKKDPKYFDCKRFIKCVRNLNLKEFAVLYYILDKNNIINIKNFVNEDIYKYIYNFKDFDPFIKIPYNIFKVYPKLIEKLIKALIDFSNNKLTLSNANNLILPGGKKKYDNESGLSVLKREIGEELNLDLDMNNIKYLNEFYEFKTIDENIKPVICMYIHDKILNFNYLDFTYIIKTDKTFYEIKSNFKKNFEIYNLYASLIINFNNYILRLDNIKSLLKIYVKCL